MPGAIWPSGMGKVIIARTRQISPIGIFAPIIRKPEGARADNTLETLHRGLHAREQCHVIRARH